MQKHKGIALLIIGVLVIVVVSGLTWLGNVRRDKIEMGQDRDVVVMERDEEGRPTIQIRSGDIACKPYPGKTEVSREQRVEGLQYEELKTDTKIVVTNTCGGMTFVLGGAVTQTIAYMHDDLDQLEIIKLDTDYNFDGFNDFEVVRITSGGGEDPNTTYMSDIYLYDQTTKQFVYNAELSKLRNISVDPEQKYVIEEESYYTKSNEHVEAYQNYQWTNGHLVKVNE